MDKKLSDGSEVLFRQIHPKSIENGIPASDRFRPSARDQNMLSIDRSSIVTAEQSYNNYIATGRESSAVFGVTVTEFEEEAIVCIEDPIEATPEIAANPAHALADYSPHTAKDQKNIAKRLQRIALLRGQLHPVVEKKS